jgi:hypothetical protein
MKYALVRVRDGEVRDVELAAAQALPAIAAEAGASA